MIKMVTMIMMVALLGLLDGRGHSSSTIVVAFSPMKKTTRRTSLSSPAKIIPVSSSWPTTHIVLYSQQQQEDDDVEVATLETKLSLEDKMKKWEASEEEIKAATLGGVVPGSVERTDAFDVGLYIAFPVMVVSGLLFALFPIIMGNIDTSSVGPPPMT